MDIYDFSLAEIEHFLRNADVGFHGYLSPADVRRQASFHENGRLHDYVIGQGSSRYVIEVKRFTINVNHYEENALIAVAAMTSPFIEQIAGSKPDHRKIWSKFRPSLPEGSTTVRKLFRRGRQRSVITLNKTAYPEQADEIDAFWEEFTNKGVASQFRTFSGFTFSIVIRWGTKFLVIVGLLEKLAHWFRSA